MRCRLGRRLRDERRSMAHVKGLTLPDLGIGAGYALWGFRAIAAGRLGCTVLVRGYERAFGDKGAEALSLLHDLTTYIGRDGVRIVRLSPPGSCSVTSDEVSFIAMVAAAQERDQTRCEAHLSWLSGRSANYGAAETAIKLAALFTAIGMEIKRPEIEPQAPAPTHAPVLKMTHQMTGSA